ncbi:Glycosyltransferase family 92 protein [Thalictrum thalictroides]|uniref:Glycosyltransferase family 92 protein n=1 Tax=Thalictrum thalictroides TaxID=46969 RepID=A0A7J6VSU3_THATH|nr:Glycosyltransferase family 92 protein [Thalictrum thalictroides]
MMGSKSFQPILTIHPLSLLSVHNSWLQSDVLFQLRVVDRIVFPDHVLLLLIAKNDGQSLLMSSAELECVYQVEQQQLSSTMVEVAHSVLSVDEYNGLELIVRCPSPPANYSAIVNLRRRGSRGFDEGNLSLIADRSIHSWEKLVYGAVLDGETAVMFVKGLNLRADRESDASQFSCHFGWGNAERSTQYVLTTRAITAAQEVIRCSVPRSLQKLPAKAHGVRVTLGIPTYTNTRNHRRSNRLEGLGGASHHRLPSVAKLIDLKLKDVNHKYDLCVCTMVWNQASSLREWIAYHSWLGVERWFIYDNNSEDSIKEVINGLEEENYNVSRHVWPWIKTQEAGFSHCALRAKSECKWVGFIDVDEYYYFPVPATDRPLTNKLVYPGRNSLRSVVAKFSDSTTVGEIRTTCHSFGPSGLNSIPPRGVTVGYTCRLKSPERHKSIVRPDALDDTLLTVVHHFHLRPGYKSFNLPQSTAVINHYKYQVWESFRAKFSRRVATYVADWQENQNEGSKDRAPGLGTEAIEPPNWSRQFCEVWDTGLKDFIMASLADQDSGLLPWERSLP